MTKEKRLGRGLEALLGRAPLRADSEPVAAASPAPPSVGHGAAPLDPYSNPAATYDAGLDPFGSYASSSVPARPSADDLLGHAAVEPKSAAVSRVAESRPPARLPLGKIDSNPYQPRQDFDPKEIAELAASLRQHGLLQPVVVRRVGERYQLIAGERRLRAAGEAGWNDVPVQIVEADDRQTAELAIVENLQRKDLNPLEKAASFARYLDQYDCTQEELAGRLDIDRSTIANLIRLLELPDAVQHAVRSGKVTQGHARALLPLGDEAEQVAFCRRIQDEGLSVRQTEAMVQELIDHADAEPLSVIAPGGDSESGSAASPRARKGANVAALEQEFRAALGVRVKLSHNAKGKGKLVIPFSDHEEFQRLRQHICGTPPAKTKSRAG